MGKEGWPHPGDKSTAQGGAVGPPHGHKAVGGPAWSEGHWWRSGKEQESPGPEEIKECETGTGMWQDEAQMLTYSHCSFNHT